MYAVRRCSEVEVVVESEERCTILSQSHMLGLKLNRVHVRIPRVVTDVLCNQAQSSIKGES